MSRFRFRLQTVLDHRERVERDKMRLLADAQRELVAAQERVRDLRADYERTGEELRVRHAELQGMELYNYYAHMDYVLRGIREAEKVVSTCEIQVARAQVNLLAARRDKQILDKLKERRKTVFDNEQRAAEQKMFDDLNARRYGRGETGLGGTA